MYTWFCANFSIKIGEFDFLHISFWQAVVELTPLLVSISWEAYLESFLFSQSRVCRVRKWFTFFFFYRVRAIDKFKSEALRRSLISGSVACDFITPLPFRVLLFGFATICGNSWRAFRAAISRSLFYSASISLYSASISLYTELFCWYSRVVGL